MAVSTFTFIGSLFIMSFITNFWAFFFVWGFMFSISIALFLWVPLTLGAEWFPKNKGLVNGINLCVTVIGAGLLPILIRSIIDLDTLADSDRAKLIKD